MEKSPQKKHRVVVLDFLLVRWSVADVGCEKEEKTIFMRERETAKIWAISNCDILYEPYDDVYPIVIFYYTCM